MKIVESQLNMEGMKEEQDILFALKSALAGMEERKPNARKEGKGDPKYEILYRFIIDAEENGFEKTYSNLQDYEKHAIITRLEGEAYNERLSHHFVEKFRRDLYGVLQNEDGGESLNCAKQRELEEAIQRSRR